MLVLLVLAVGLFHLVTLRSGDDLHGDAMQLLIHAQNLVKGDPYAATGYIQNPGRFYSPVGYPPGYPLVLAPFVALFGASPLLVKVVVTGFLTVAVGALALLFRRGLPALYTCTFVVAAGLQPYLWEAKHFGFSGFAVLCFASLSFVLYEAEGRRGPLALHHLAAGTLAGYAAATHPLAWVLLPAFLAGDLLRDRRVTRRFALAATGVVLCYGAITLFIDTSAGARIAPSVGGIAGGYGSLLVTNVLKELMHIPGWAVDRLYDYGRTSFILWYMPLPGGRILKYALLLLSFVPAGWGWARRVRRHGSAEAFCVLYFAGLLPWAFGDVRYLIPLIPFYYAYLLIGLDALRVSVGPRARLATAFTLLALVVVYASRYGFTERADSDQSELAAVYDFIRSETPASAVFVMNEDPRHLPFHTDRAASLGPHSPGEWPSYASRIGADYALVQTDQDSAVGFQDMSAFQTEFERGSWRVYRLSPPLPTPPNSEGSRQ